MASQITQKLTELAPQIEAALHAHFPAPPARDNSALLDCMRYATFGGGRRMRPMLCLLAADVYGAVRKACLPLAAAVEYLHAASLIYDDLPCMDDATSRRGLPPAHARFGEGTALLAGLSLVTHAFHLLSPWPSVVSLAARSVGHEGMCTGQSLDLQGSARDDRHYLKTTALFRLAVAAPGVAFGADASRIAALGKFAGHFGAAYQLMDDADDEFANGLAARAQSEHAAAIAALHRLPGDGPTASIAAYATHLLAPVLTRE